MAHVKGFSHDQGASSAYTHGSYVRVEVEVLNAGQMIGDAPVKHGTHTVDIPEFELAGIEALVETELEAVKVSKRMYEKALAEHLEKHPDGAMPADSASARFRQMVDRDMLPLGSVTVIARDIPPPLSEEDRWQVAVAKAAASGGQTEVVQNFNAPMDPEEKALMDRRSERAAETAEKTAKPKPKGRPRK